MELQTSKLGGHMAVAVSGLDIGRPIDAGTQAGLRRLLNENLVLCIRGQDLAPVPFRDAMARFRAERQILANLAHPNIARLLDGGVTPAGQPYLVMEYIHGEPIDTWCRDRGLSVRAFLELFRAVCAGVQCAHQNLVVHRDIKPGNILVDETGTPKLLDFGVAKLLDTAGDAAGPMTRMMTPEYASPEQILGQPVTTATDVYSAAVMLYRLLSGRHPAGASLDTPAALVQATSHLEVGLLVAAAGFGTSGEFLQGALAEELAMLDVMWSWPIELLAVTDSRITAS